MEQNDGEAPVEEQQDLPRERFRVHDPFCLEHLPEPLLELFLCAAPIRIAGCPRHAGEFGGGAQEAAALPFRMSGDAGKIEEDALNFRCHVAFGFAEPFPEELEVRLIAPLEIAAIRSSLAFEVIIERSLRHAGRLGDGVHADGRIPSA